MQSNHQITLPKTYKNLQGKLTKRFFWFWPTLPPILFVIALVVPAGQDQEPIGVEGSSQLLACILFSFVLSVVAMRALNIRLVIDQKGITVHKFIGKRFVSWDDIEKFEWRDHHYYDYQLFAVTKRGARISLQSAMVGKEYIAKWNPSNPYIRNEVSPVNKHNVLTLAVLTSLHEMYKQNGTLEGTVTLQISAEAVNAAHAAAYQVLGSRAN